MNKACALFIVYALLIISISRALNIYEYEIEPWEKVHNTEYIAYQLLKNDPIDKDINYLAIPWWPLLWKNKLDAVPKITLNGGFTICQWTHIEMLLPLLKKIGIEVVFASHTSNQKKYEGIKVIPFPLSPLNGIGPAKEKDLLYSFIGFHTFNPERLAIFKLPQYKDVVIKRRENWHFWGPNQEAHKKEYQDILSRSRFSLCPAGAGPSSIRFWESLQAGAIPVLLADELLLPDTFDWKTCIIRIAEKDVYKIDKIIRSIPLDREKKMRANCYKAYEQFCGENLVSVIRDYYKKR